MNFQRSENGCGRAAARNLLVLLYKSRHYESASFPTPMENFEQIQSGLQKYGALSIGYFVDDKGLQKLQRPFIAQVKKEEGEHFVVVKKGHQRLTVLDAAIGTVKMSQKSFLAIATGNVLEVKEKAEKQRPQIRLWSKKGLNAYLGFSFLEILFLIGSLFLSTFWQSGIYLAGGLLLSFSIAGVKKIYVLRANKRIDLNFILPFYEKHRDDETYEALSELKSEYFTSLALLINQAELLATMILLAALQNIYLFICAGIIIVFTFATALWLTPHLRHNQYKTEICERKMRNAIKSGDDFASRQYYLSGEKIAKRCLFYHYLARIIPFMLALITSAGILAYQKEFTVENIAFSAGYLFILASAVLRMNELENHSDFHLSALVDLTKFPLMKTDKHGVLWE